MEYAKKMVLLPEDSLNRHHNTLAAPDNTSINDLTGGSSLLPTAQTPGDAVSRLDNQLFHILSSKTPKDDSERWKQFQEILRRFLFYNNKTAEEEKDYSEPDFVDINGTTPPSSKTLLPAANGYSIEVIMGAFPKTFRNKGGALINYIKATDVFKRLSWDSQGEATIDGRKIPGSSIIDLLNDAVRYRKAFTPLGREEFIRFLKSLNTPRDFVSNQLYWNTYIEKSPLLPRARKTNTPPRSARRLVYNSSDEESQHLVNRGGYKRRIREIPRRLQRRKWEQLKD